MPLSVGDLYAAYQPLINAIKGIVKDTLAPALSNASMLFPEEKISRHEISGDFIEYFLSIANISILSALTSPT